jgi:predicted DNA binding CopG/RHH family protein
MQLDVALRTRSGAVNTGARTKAAAEAAGVPYQALIKKAVDRVVTQLEKRPALLC